MTTLWSFTSLLLDMAIEFVDLPIKNGDYVIVHSFFS
jgi:hydrogenase maturation factor